MIKKKYYSKHTTECCCIKWMREKSMWPTSKEFVTYPSVLFLLLRTRQQHPVICDNTIIINVFWWYEGWISLQNIRNWRETCNWRKGKYSQVFAQKKKTTEISKFYQTASIKTKIWVLLFFISSTSELVKKIQEVKISMNFGFLGYFKACFEIFCV